LAIKLFCIGADLHGGGHTRIVERLVSMQNISGVSLAEAHAFLDALGGKNRVWHAQTYCDPKEPEIDPITGEPKINKRTGKLVLKDKYENLVTTCSGTTGEVLTHLVPMNKRKAACHVAINECRGPKRGKEHLTNIYAAYCDFDYKDGDDPISLEYLQQVEVPPSMVIQTSSPFNLHAYWILESPVPVDGPAVVERSDAMLRGIQQAFEAFGADPACAESARVLGVPGLKHWKYEDKPIQIKIVQPDTGKRYTMEKLEAAYPPAASPEPERGNGDGKDGSAKNLEAAAEYLRGLPPSIQGEEGSLALWMAALIVQSKFSLTVDQAVSLIMEHFNPRCVPVWSEAQVRKKVTESAPGSPKRRNNRRMESDEEPTLVMHSYTDERPGLHHGNWRITRKAFTVAASATDLNGKNPYTVVDVFDADGTVTRLEVPYAVVLNERAFGEYWASQGQWVAVGGTRLLASYVSNEETPTEMTLLPNAGIHVRGNEVIAIVTPSGDIIPPTAQVIFTAQFRADMQETSAEKGGTWEGQRETMAMALGNNYLVMGYCAAFYAQVAFIAGLKGKVIHVWQNETGIGKSNIARACQSCLGPIKELPSWQTKLFAAETRFALSNCHTWVLDELTPATDPSVVFNVIFMVGNGIASDKGSWRGEASNLRHRDRSTTLLLSTGEISAKASQGEGVQGGFERRCVEVELPSNKAEVFPNWHGHPDSRAFVKAFEAGCKSHFGHAVPRFDAALYEWIQKDGLEVVQDQIRRSVAKFRADAIEKHLKDKPIESAIDDWIECFAVLATAGELGITFGALPWLPTTAAQAMEEILAKVIKDRGTERKEVLDIKAKVYDIYLHHLEHFKGYRYEGYDLSSVSRTDLEKLLSNSGSEIKEQWGFRVPNVADGLAIPELWFTSFKPIFPTLGKNRAAKLLAEDGWLESAKGETVTIYGKSVYVHKVKASAIKSYIDAQAAS
jgi:hypothetical protein